MKIKNECEIVYDLLPNYIEKLTNEISNEFIENHLAHCEKCKKLYDDLSTEINSKQNSTKEINFLKKYKRHLNALKIVLVLVIVLIVAIGLGKFLKKYNVLKLISETSQQNQTIDNYHILEYYYTEGHILKMEQFKMGDKNKFTYTMETENGIVTETTYGYKVGENEYRGNTYIEDGDNKFVRKNITMNRELFKDSVLYNANPKDLLKYSFDVTINTTTFRNTECYYINNLPILTGGKYERVYFDKTTGLMIGASQVDSSQNSATPIESVYEYNVVTDKDFIEPNISEYKEQG